jgi:hypothetical protein
MKNETKKLILERGKALILLTIMNKTVKGKGYFKNPKNQTENILNMKNFFICEKFAVLEFENEVLAVFGNNLYQFKEQLIKAFSFWKESNEKNPLEHAKEIMRGYFSEYFLSLDLKKDEKLYEFYFNKKIKPLLEQQ